MSMSQGWQKRVVRILAVLVLLGLMTVLFRISVLANATTVALCFLLVVLASATLWGLLEAIVASVFATLCFNYSFLPPVGTLTIADPQDWVALFVFLIVSIVASQLSERTRRMAAENARARELAARASLLRQEEEFKSTLLDALAHDLKTPLTSLKASVSALLANPAQLSANHRELLSIVEEETDRLNRLVSETLQLARLEAAKLRLNREICSVESLIQRALEQTRRLLNGRDVQLQISPALSRVNVDADLILTVLGHLLDNAAKYSPAGQPISISAEPQDHQVCISVRDRGPGLSEEELSAVFEKYYRGQPTRDFVGGMGMGLAIARDVVAAHGGRIWAESLLGQGARFSFTLPALAEDAQP